MVVSKVLVQVYGEGVKVFFNRDDEVRMFECVSRMVLQYGSTRNQ
jgi:choline/ethanolamine kinase